MLEIYMIFEGLFKVYSSIQDYLYNITTGISKGGYMDLSKVGLIGLTTMLSVFCLFADPNPQITWYGHNATGGYAIDSDDLPYLESLENGRMNIRHVPLCEERGLVMTFAVMVKDCWLEDVQYGQAAVFDSLRAWELRGFEVANHTWTHKRIRASNYESEILQAQDTLEVFLGHRPYFFIYPEDIYDDDSNDFLREHGYIGACAGEQEEDNPATVNPRDWTDCIEAGFRCMMDTGSLWPVPPDPLTGQIDFFNGYVDEIIAEGGWGIRMMHGIEGNYAWGWVYEEAFATHLDYCVEKINAGDLWVETCGNLCRYITERDQYSVSLGAYDSESFEIEWTLSDLDTAVYNYPLTIKVDLPDGYSNLTIQQNGEALEYTELTNDSIWFEASPNAGKITIINDGGGSVAVRQSQLAPGNSLLLSCSPNPVKNHAQFSYTVPPHLNGEKVSLSLYNAAGKCVRKWASVSQEKGRHRVQWKGMDQSGRQLANGVYVFRLKVGNITRSFKTFLIR